MTRLDKYRSALLVAFPDIPDAELSEGLEKGGPDFVSFVIAYGLGPLWHARTGRDEFRESRLSAEALYAAQEHALIEIGQELDNAGIEFVVFKGAANRLLWHDNPALRACYDFDLLVHSEDRVAAASALVTAGFSLQPEPVGISRGLVLTRGIIDVDMHWGLLREGRLRCDDTSEMLDRRRRVLGTWMLDPQDALFVLLVHPAFAKHLAGWDMGLHRVADIVTWLQTQLFDWQAVRARLEQDGVRTAAWATLRWVQMLTYPRTLAVLDAMISDLRPGRLRRMWLEWWLRNDMSARLSSTHWARLLGLSLFLHDTFGDAARAVKGRLRARRRTKEDLAAFRELSG